MSGLWRGVAPSSMMTPYNTSWRTWLLTRSASSCSCSRARVCAVRWIMYSSRETVYHHAPAAAVHHRCPSSRAGSGVERLDPLRWLAGCRKRRAQGFFECLLFIRATFFCYVSVRLCAFCFPGVLVKLSVLAKWLATKTLLRKPLGGKKINATKPRPKSAKLWLLRARNYVRRLKLLSTRSQSVGRCCLFICRVRDRHRWHSVELRGLCACVSRWLLAL